MAEQVAQALVSGLLMGLIYALAAAGLGRLVMVGLDPAIHGLPLRQTVTGTRGSPAPCPDRPRRLYRVDGRIKSDHDVYWWWRAPRRG